MMFVKFLEFALIIFIVFTISSEVIIPAMAGRKIFQSFRKEGKLNDKLTEAKQKKHEQSILDEINRVKEKV